MKPQFDWSVEVFRTQVGDVFIAIRIIPHLLAAGKPWFW